MAKIVVVDPLALFEGDSGTIGNTVTQLIGSPGLLGGWYLYNPNSVVSYCQLFDLPRSQVVLGTTTPKFSLGIPPTGGANQLGKVVLPFRKAIVFAFTTTRSGSSAPTSTCDWNLFYRPGL